MTWLESSCKSLLSSFSWRILASKNDDLHCMNASPRYTVGTSASLLCKTSLRIANNAVNISQLSVVMQTSQSQALGEFFHAFRLNPHQPLTLLCIALGYMQQAMTRKVDDRNRVVLQAFAFLQVRLAVLPSVATSVHGSLKVQQLAPPCRANVWQQCALQLCPA